MRLRTPFSLTRHSGILCSYLLLVLIVFYSPMITVAEAPPDSACDCCSENIMITAIIPSDGDSIEIKGQLIDDIYYLFLPAYTDLSALHLRIEGIKSDAAAPLSLSGGPTMIEGIRFINTEAIDWISLSTQKEQGEYRAILYCAKHKTILSEICVMKAEGLRTLFLDSNDPVNEGREWLEACKRHEKETSATMKIIDIFGRINHAEEITRLRGRGNSTWRRLKKAYQMKLASKTDLLDTGLAAERNKTWVLLADAMDLTLLHNRITFDLGRELGLVQTPYCEHVALYYDGEYRGLYLLTEKVEINEGRVDQYDYDELIESWNRVIGNNRLDELDTIIATNKYGLEYQYIENLYESDQPDAGAFLLELESNYSLSEECWFATDYERKIGLKSPDYAGPAMMKYISEYMEEARLCLVNHGINPDTGLKTNDYFDIDAFARTLLIHELAGNIDGYLNSSSFFVLPAKSRRFEPGPLWDFDLAYRPSSFRYHSYGVKADGTGLRCDDGWAFDFFCAPDILYRMHEIYNAELYPIVTEILLGNERGKYLKPLTLYVAEISAAQRMESKVWKDPFKQQDVVYGNTYDEDIAMMRAFLQNRSKWLRTRLSPNYIGLEVSAVYTLVDSTIDVQLDPRTYSNAVVRSFQGERLTEATESDYAVYQLEIVLEPVSGYQFDQNCIVCINNEQIPSILQGDGTIVVHLQFEDPSYRPVDYDGEDVGLVFNYDYCIAAYPEIAEEYGYDREAILEYFFTEGIEQGQMGNEFFDPKEVLLHMPRLYEALGESWELYYPEFLNSGYEDWMFTMNKRFYPVAKRFPDPSD